MSAHAVVSRSNRTPRVRVSVPLVTQAGTWLLAFALVGYLAFEGGGYATVVRGQVGIALWWMVLVGALVGVLPVALNNRAWVVIGVLGGLLIWTLLSLNWTESSERTFVEVGRVAALLGAAVLSLAVVGRQHARQVVNGVACAVGLVALLAVVSRLHPGWLGDSGQFVSKSRLSYPLNYWNALAGFIAMGLPAVLMVATSGRTIMGRSVAAAALPVMGLCVFLTISRGGLIASTGAVLLFVVLCSYRLPKIATIGAAAVGGAILISAASSRHALRDGLGNELAKHQGSEVLALLFIVALAVAAIQAAISLVDRHATPIRVFRIDRRRAWYLGAGGVAVALVVALAAGGPGLVSEKWQEFKQRRAPLTVSTNTTFERLASTTGNGRYQYWQEAAMAQQSKPLEGRGAGTFAFWWARNRSNTGGYVRDAHSLYMQTFGELGLPGLLLVVSFLLLLLGSAVARAIRTDPDDHVRLPIAAAGAGILAFMITASVEWVWQIAVLPVTLVLLGAVALSGPSLGFRGEPAKPSVRGRIAVGLMAIVCLPLLAISVAGASSVADSQAAFNRGDLAGALKEARTAERVQPYAASPRLQEALVLEAAGNLNAAANAIAAATVREPTNSDHWLIRARIAAEQGRAKSAVRYWEKARSLNPYGLIFQQAK